MSFEVQLPDLGEGIDGATVSCWLVGEGDFVTEGNDIVEMSTDKAVFNVHAPVSGTVKQILVDDGDEVKVAETLAIIEEQ